MTTPDLNFVSSDDLLNELLSRCDHALFTGLVVMTGEENGEGVHRVMRRWVGNSHTNMGLAHDLQTRILEDYRIEEGSVDPDTPDDEDETE